MPTLQVFAGVTLIGYAAFVGLPLLWATPSRAQAAGRTKRCMGRTWAAWGPEEWQVLNMTAVFTTQAVRPSFSILGEFLGPRIPVMQEQETFPMALNAEVKESLNAHAVRSVVYKPT